MNVSIMQQDNLSHQIRIDPSMTFEHNQHRKRAASCGQSNSSNKHQKLSLHAYTKRDILSGRGGLANKHFGNKVFRRLIRHNKDLYRRLKSKRKQDLLIKSILLAVESQGGRFLKEDKASNTWYEISYKEAWSKTCQALREPDKKAGDDIGDLSDDGLSSDRSSMETTTGNDASAAMIPDLCCPPPPRLVRMYTTDNPPNADRRVFDQDYGDDINDECDDDSDSPEPVTVLDPAPLELGISSFSRPGFSIFNNQSITGHQQLPRLRQQESHAYSNFNTSSILPPALGRGCSSTMMFTLSQPVLDTTVMRTCASMDMQQTFDAYNNNSNTNLVCPNPSQLESSETIGSFALGSLAALNSANHAGAGASASCCPPPLLRYSSSAFMRGLEEIALQRQESTASVDLLS